MELNPDDDFERVLIDMVDLSRKKRTDYSAGENPWQNFVDVAQQMQNTAGHSVETLIATKQSRLRNLLQKHWSGKDGPRNESVEDTLIDRAVYSVISICLWREGGYSLEKGNIRSETGRVTGDAGPQDPSNGKGYYWAR